MTKNKMNKTKQRLKEAIKEQKSLDDIYVKFYLKEACTPIFEYSIKNDLEFFIDNVFNFMYKKEVTNIKAYTKYIQIDLMPIIKNHVFFVETLEGG